VTPPAPVVGDVLILRTTKSFCIHALGVVEIAGQVDFAGHPVTLISDPAHALAQARHLCTSGHAIYLRDLDTETWTAIGVE